jgi:hypothetical protein
LLLSEVAAVVAQRTQKDERAVRVMLRDNWPDTTFFKPVQVELAVNLIERKEGIRPAANPARFIL